MTYEELLRAAYGAYNRGDYDGAAAHFSPDIAWQVPGYESLAGREAVRGFFGSLGEMFAAHEIVVDELLEQGDRCDAHVTHRFTRPDGVSAEFRSVHAWTRDGDLLRKMDETADTLAFAVLTGQVPAPATA